MREPAQAPATARSGGTTYHFCSDHCQQRFTAAPARSTGPEQAAAQGSERWQRGEEMVVMMFGYAMSLARASHGGALIKDD